MARIIIQVDGGLVQEVFLQGNGKITEAIVVDEDVEGADAEDITTVELNSIAPLKSSYEAVVHTEEITKLPKDSDVAKMVDAYLNK